ncbi:DUF4097 family beta strand repeat-containing protein [Virgibacillus doumboii]|uniref:DUF4097 family beta strand repeat-containing protein n=1 Tax=Virgibacillus doumboii TaxID=2697503 RepID=UPI0013E0333A|nr:DUF4097 family beta strand repeat-containing protein [Virgibacillus doumboii]
MKLFGLGKKMNPIHLQEEMTGDNVEKVRITASSADIQVTPATGDAVEVLLEGEISEGLEENLEFEVQQNNNMLLINVDLNMGFQFGMYSTNLTLNVNLPSKVYSDLYVKSSSGDIIVKNIAADAYSGTSSSGNQLLTGLDVLERMILKASSGNMLLKNNRAGSLIGSISSGRIDVRDYTSNKVKLDASSGGISIHNEILEGTTECSVSSGNIHINSGEFTGNLDLRATSGNVDVYSKKFPDDLHIDCQNQSGNRSINVKGLTISENSKNRLTGLMGESDVNTIKVKTTSGNVVVSG